MSKAARGVTRGIGLATALALSLTLAACGSDDDSGAAEADAASALKKGGTLTVWAWEPTMKTVVKDFQAEHPNVKIKLVNAGTGNDQYTALQNAAKAGSGVPDLAQIEYFALGQFSLAKSLTDLGPIGADKLSDTYSTGPWNAVTEGDAVYGLPLDSGPMAFFYNKKVFDKHKIQVPKTWDEYVTAAEKLHKADPKVYMTADNGDAGFATSMIWQAGGRPYSVDGTEVGVDFTDKGSSDFAANWQKMLDGKLLSQVPGWTDEWFKGLGDGTIASLATGAWMPANLESGAAAAKGDWRVAPLPQWKAGDTSSSESGGSAITVPEASRNKALAYAFAEYAAAKKGVRTRLSEGAFPATKADLESPEFLNKKFDFFGGQEANKVFAESAAAVGDKWTYLPFQVYANSVFKDTVGKSYISGLPLTEGLKQWQKASTTYATEQGFTLAE